MPAVRTVSLNEARIFQWLIRHEEPLPIKIEFLHAVRNRPPLIGQNRLFFALYGASGKTSVIKISFYRQPSGIGKTWEKWSFKCVTRVDD